MQTTIQRERERERVVRNRKHQRVWRRKEKQKERNTIQRWKILVRVENKKTVEKRWSNWRWKSKFGLNVIALFESWSRKSQVRLLMFGYVTSCFDRYRNKTEREREKWMLNLKQNILVCDSRENFFSFCFLNIPCLSLSSMTTFINFSFSFICTKASLCLSFIYFI